MLEVPCCQQFDPVHGGNRDVGCVPWLGPRNRVSIKQQISERFCTVAAIDHRKVANHSETF
ncbi:hypothetical protein [Stieleria neptunia]|uniref:hypothetical protein n=1 Tax=Stieleria neptunia TaxID=2527979 RepID=UPI0011A475AF|nr:hypothetical protein [Stieleria neptunia]